MRHAKRPNISATFFLIYDYLGQYSLCGVVTGHGSTCVYTGVLIFRSRTRPTCGHVSQIVKWKQFINLPIRLQRFAIARPRKADRHNLLESTIAAGLQKKTLGHRVINGVHNLRISEKHPGLIAYAMETHTSYTSTNRNLLRDKMHGLNSRLRVLQMPRARAEHPAIGYSVYSHDFTHKLYCSVSLSSTASHDTLFRMQHTNGGHERLCTTVTAHFCTFLWHERWPICVLSESNIEKIVQHIFLSYKYGTSCFISRVAECGIVSTNAGRLTAMVTCIICRA